MIDIIEKVRPIITDVDQRARVYKGIIEAMMEGQDWDTTAEPTEMDNPDPAYKMALRDVDRNSGEWEVEFEHVNAAGEKSWTWEPCPKVSCPECPFNQDCWFGDVPEIK